jgi:uncharacterized membrane-anchored protein
VSVRYVGCARLDRRTKNLVTRLGPSDIAFVDHADMDRVSAESIVATGCEVVVNAAASISGSYPNIGPLVLVRAGVQIVDAAGPEVFDRIKEGTTVEVEGGDILVDGQVVASGTRLTPAEVEAATEAAKGAIGERLDEFARNTLAYLTSEKELLTEGVGVPHVNTAIQGRPVLVVVRGYDYREDLHALHAYIREVRPVLIGVDGGADALIEDGMRPHLIVGDMDSVSDAALRCGAEIVVHAYADGRAPGLERIEELGLSAVVWPVNATSEDLALLLAFENGADLIVAVGTHYSLVEYLDKGRRGMSSTFLTRLRVGPKLIDAKGVSKLYRTGASPGQLALIVLAGLFTMAAVIIVSPGARFMVELTVLKLRAAFGF